MAKWLPAFIMFIYLTDESRQSITGQMKTVTKLTSNTKHSLKRGRGFPVPLHFVFSVVCEKYIQPTIISYVISNFQLLRESLTFVTAGSRKLFPRRQLTGIIRWGDDDGKRGGHVKKETRPSWKLSKGERSAKNTKEEGSAHKRFPSYIPSLVLM